MVYHSQHMTEKMTDDQTTVLSSIKEPGGTTGAMAQIQIVSIFLIRMMIGVLIGIPFLVRFSA